MRKTALAILFAATSLQAAASGTDLFESKIRPVLVQSCYPCHSSKMKMPMGGLALDTKSGVLAGGNSGPVISGVNPDQSLLIRALRYHDVPRMPPSGKLADPVIKDFEQWIAQGAPDPRTEQPAPGASAGGKRVIDYTKGRQWWAFQPVAERAAPKVSAPKWERTKVDAFILAKLDEKHLSPSPEADPRTLITRAYLDLAGYKPTVDEIEAYIADKSATRYEQLIDRLLASPQYGERMARYWMDVARYAEDGLAGAQFSYAWRYRDWLIDAFNQDVPYNRFVQLQLAADLIPNTPRKDLAALGYLGLGPVEHKEFKLSKDVIEGFYLDEWDERLDSVSRGMLGLTVTCARCHDHKFDPISIKDYYSMAGVFASTQNAVRPLNDEDPAIEQRFIWARQRYSDLNAAIGDLSGNKDIDQKTAAVKIQACKDELAVLKPELDAMRQQHPELADLIAKTIDPKAGKPAGPMKKFTPDPKDSQAPYVNAVYDAGLWLDDSHPDYTLVDLKPNQPRDLAVYFRGTGGTATEKPLQRSFLTVLAKNPNQKFGPGSGRLDLANAIVNDAAPLTARVIVNRIWGQTFGSYLVGTPSDFGDRGDRPTNPALLDDLTARFIAHNWSIKWLQREILLSATYRQSSKPRADAIEKDEANSLLWRMNPRRVDVEAFRDTLLRSSGSLDPTMFGPSLDLEASGNTRRTLYARISRAKLNDLLRLYDFPTPMQHSPTRIDTMTPLQQLFVMNSPFIEQLAATLAKSVESEQPTDQIRDLYRKALARNPTAAEIDSALTYTAKASLPRFAQTLLATNEEIFWP